MAEKFWDEHSKSMRLSGTVCMWKGSPVYCIMRTGRRNAGPDEILVASLTSCADTYSDKFWTAVNYLDPQFSYDAVPLGYMNLKGTAYYLARNPAQQQSAGLPPGSIYANKNLPHSWFATQAFEDCILKKYPTIFEALAQLSDGTASSVAFTSKLAVASIGRRVSLEYQGNPVGFIAANGRVNLWQHKTNRIIGEQLKNAGVTYVIDYL